MHCGKKIGRSQIASHGSALTWIISEGEGETKSQPNKNQWRKSCLCTDLNRNAQACTSTEFLSWLKSCESHFFVAWKLLSSFRQSIKTHVKKEHRVQVKRGFPFPGIEIVKMQVNEIFFHSVKLKWCWKYLLMAQMHQLYRPVLNKASIFWKWSFIWRKIVPMCDTWK